MAWTAVAGAATASLGGALLNGSSSGGSTKTQASEPWAPAQPWLQNNITTGQNLQNYYQSHPLNSLQQQGYQNLYGSLDNWNNSTAPALQAVANRLMGSNYARSIGQQNYQQPSIGGQGGGMGGALGGYAGGMRGGVDQLGQGQSYSQMMSPQGTQSNGGQGGGLAGALGGYAGGVQGGVGQLGQGQGYAQMMGNNPMMSMGGGQGGLLGPAIAQQFQQPQMDVTQGQGLYGLLNWSALMPDVNKLNKDAEAEANSKKPKTQDTSSTSNQWTDNTGGGGM